MNSHLRTWNSNHVIKFYFSFRNRFGHTVVNTVVIMYYQFCDIRMCAFTCTKCGTKAPVNNHFQVNANFNYSASKWKVHKLSRYSIFISSVIKLSHLNDDRISELWLFAEVNARAKIKYFSDMYIYA